MNEYTPAAGEREIANTVHTWRRRNIVAKIDFAIETQEFQVLRLRVGSFALLLTTTAATAVCGAGKSVCQRSGEHFVGATRIAAVGARCVYVFVLSSRVVMVVLIVDVFVYGVQVAVFAVEKRSGRGHEWGVAAAHWVGHFRIGVRVGGRVATAHREAVKIVGYAYEHATSRVYEVNGVVVRTERFDNGRVSNETES